MFSPRRKCTVFLPMGTSGHIGRKLTFRCHEGGVECVRACVLHNPPSLLPSFGRHVVGETPKRQPKKGRTTTSRRRKRTNKAKKNEAWATERRLGAPKEDNLPKALVRLLLLLPLDLPSPPAAVPIVPPASSSSVLGSYGDNGRPCRSRVRQGYIPGSITRQDDSSSSW